MGVRFLFLEVGSVLLPCPNIKIETKVCRVKNLQIGC